MKRFFLAALAAALLIPGASLCARAQDDGPGRGGYGGGGYGGGGYGAPSPERREQMAAKLKEKLGLSDDQAAKFKDAEKSHFETMKPIHEQMKALMEKLHTQVDAKAADGDLKATLDALKAQRKAMVDEQEKFHAAVAGILTPMQQAKFVLGAAHRMRSRMGEMRGPGRGPGPRGRGPRGDDKGGNSPRKGDDGDDGQDD